MKTNNLPIIKLVNRESKAKHAPHLLLSWCFLLLLFSPVYASPKNTSPTPAAERLELYLPGLKNKRVGLVVNQTSRIQSAHLVDVLQKYDMNIVRIFAPEHGFRGTADAGEHLKDGIDKKSGLPVVSLYGKQKKPRPEMLQDLDIIIFDIQDVGVRYYTYISSMHYVMEAAAENDKSILILDRPNPNGDYIDGPVLDPEFRSFVGMHPIPLVHGLTVGELARMIVGEHWIKHADKLDLSVIPIKDYNHQSSYELPIKPSPNLPNPLSIRLYPSLGLFEGTVVSVGRGTKSPFQVLGLPQELQNRGTEAQFHFTPIARPGAQWPPYQNQTCTGIDLRNDSPSRFTLRYLDYFQQRYIGKKPFFNPFFDKLAGTDQLRKKLEQGWSETSIRRSWQEDLGQYLKLRKQYLLYPDF